MNQMRFLYNPDLSLKSEPYECVFQALGFGPKSASAQSETVKEILANEIRKKEPEFLYFLMLPHMSMIWAIVKKISKNVLS